MLNKQCDDLENFSRTELWNHTAVIPPLDIPYETTAIYIGAHKVYRNFQTTLLDQCSTPIAYEYYTRKYNWAPDTFSNINWEAAHTVMHMCSPATRTWVSKFSSGFLGTIQMMSRRDQWIDMKCPCCNNENETQFHVIQCPAPAPRQRLLLLFTDLYTWMRKMGIGNDFVTHFETYTQAWLHTNPVPIEVALPYPFRAQLDIGWTHMLFCRMHLSFVDHIAEIYHVKGVHREAQRFCSLLVYKMWTKLLRPLWNARNKVVHALDAANAHTRLHLDLQREATELYQSTNVEMLPHSARLLFDHELHDLLRRPYYSLKAWCESVEIEITRQTSSYTDPGDHTQTLLQPIQPVPQPRDPPPLPTVSNAPTLTPIQLHIQQRRVRQSRHNHESQSQVQTPPLDPPHPRRAERRPPRVSRRRCLTLTSRVPARPQHQRRNITDSLPPHVAESVRMRLLMGSWRLP